MHFRTEFFTILLLIVKFCSSQQLGVKTCRCADSNKCFPNLPPDRGGRAEWDVRIVNTNTNTNPIPTTAPGTTAIPGNCASGQIQCCTECGLNYNIANGPTPGSGQGRYGSQPWQAIILDNRFNYLGGGVLLDANNVLTAAHKIYSFSNTPRSIVVRLGEWDAANNNSEPWYPQDSTVSRVFIHEQYVDAAKNLINDVAILRLATPIRYGPTVNPAINTACLPTATTNFENIRCVVSGWGKNAFNGAYQAIVKEVEVPVVSNSICETRMKTTKLGPNFVLDTRSFICAGGEPNKDACVGDGGSPLMCKVGNRYQVAGLVAWGIGCANGDKPGVYIRVQSFLDWINKTLKL